MTVPTSACQGARKCPRVDELRERLVKDYPRMFRGVAHKNPPDRGPFGTAGMRVKPNPNYLDIENTFRVSRRRP